MDKFVEFRDLERLSAVSIEGFLEKFKTEVNELDPEYIIKRLRLSGICVDIYGSKKYKKTLDSAIEILISSQRVPGELIQNLKSNIELLEALFDDFNRFRDQTGVNAIQVNNQIPTLLITTEIFLASLQDYCNGANIRALEAKYPFVIAFGDGRGRLAPPEAVLAKIIHLNEKVMEQVGQILKYFYYRGIPSKGLDIQISFDEIKTIRQHFDLLGRYEVLLLAYEYWRFWSGNLSRKGDRKISLDFKNENDILSQRISVFRSRILKNKWMQDFRLIRDKVTVNPNTTIFPPTDFRVAEESLSTIFCREFFGSIDLKEEILGITLAEWVRSYTILKQISETFLQQRNNYTKLTVRDWCIVKTREKWIETYILNGIDPRKAEAIIDNLTFTSKTEDLIDCPFVPLENHLVVIPSLASYISPANAMLSNFYNKEFLLNFRGKGLELKMLKMLSDNKINGKNIRTILGADEYECDVVFELNQSLFFIECKTFIQPETPRRYYEFIGKITEAANQLNRISSFYATHLDIVIKELGLRNDWKPETIYKVVVSSALLGEPFFINGCYITDDSNLKRFFDRETPGLGFGKLRIAPPDENYEGTIDVKKLINIISDPPPIKVTRGIMKKNLNEMDLEKFEFSFFNFVENEMIVPDTRSLKKLAKSLNIPMKVLKQNLDG